MQGRLRALVVLIATLGLTSGCVPLVVGGGAAIVADTVAEDQRGGDGLF